MINRLIHAMVRQERILVIISQPSSHSALHLAKSINALATITPYIHYAFDVQYWSDLHDFQLSLRRGVSIFCFDSHSQDKLCADELSRLISESHLVLCSDLMLGTQSNSYSVVSSALIGVFSHECCMLLHEAATTQRSLQHQNGASSVLVNGVQSLLCGVCCHAVGEVREVLEVLYYYFVRSRALDINCATKQSSVESAVALAPMVAIPHAAFSPFPPISVSMVCFASMPDEEIAPEESASDASEISTVLDEDEAAAVTELGPTASIEFEMPYVSAPPVSASHSLQYGNRGNSLSYAWRGLSTSSLFSDTDFGSLPPLSQFSTLSDGISRSHSLRSVDSSGGTLLGLLTGLSQEEQIQDVSEKY